MTKRHKTKLRCMISLMLAFVLILGSTLSYFADRATLSGHGDAGTVDISLTPDFVLVDADGKNIMNPGDGRQLNFGTVNNGNMSVDLKKVLRLTSSVPMTGTDLQGEFEIFKTSDIEQNADGAFYPKSFATAEEAEAALGEGNYIKIDSSEREKYPAYINADTKPSSVYVAKPVKSNRIVSYDKKTITYEIEDVVLDGNHDTPNGIFETETEADGHDDEECEYTLVFRPDSLNTFQSSEVKLDLLVSAKQHRNLDNTWEIVSSETYTFSDGSEYATVPKSRNINGQPDPEEGQQGTTPGGDPTSTCNITVTGNGFTHNAPASVENGSGLTVILTPDTGFEFTNENQVEITGDFGMNNVSISNGVATVSLSAITGNVTIDAAPALAGPGPIIIPTDCHILVIGNYFTHDAPATVEIGGGSTITLTPETGYDFTDENQIVVTGDNGMEEITISNGIATVKLKMVMEDITIEAAPALASISTDCHITVIGNNFTHDAPATVEIGRKTTITLTPETGYEFTDENQIVVTGDNGMEEITISNGIATVKLKMVMEDVTITATPNSVGGNDPSPSETLYDTVLYSDGTLVFQNQRPLDSSHGTIVAEYSDINSSNNTAPWSEYKYDIFEVEFLDEVSPTNVECWFEDSMVETVSGFDNLNLSNATSMSHMFMNCPALGSLDLSELDTSNVTNMDCMFAGCSSLSTLTLSDSFDTSNVRNMGSMFSGLPLTSLDLSGFNTTNVTDMSQMFYHCSNLSTLTLSDSFDTSNVFDMYGMFEECNNLTTIYSNSFDTSNVTDDYKMFGDCYSLVGGNGTAFSDEMIEDSSYARIDGENGNPGYFTDKSSGNTLNTQGDAYAVLDNDGKLTMFRSSDAYTDKSTGTFNDTKGREYTGKIFADIESNQMENKDDLWTDYDIATTIKSVDIADGYTITPISILRWFDCENLTTADLTGLDTRNITDMSYMFSNCSKLSTLTLSDSFDTSNVTDMSSMFSTCGSLQSLTLPDSFDTSNVTSMSLMFSGCSNLSSLTLPDSFDTSNVTNMGSMFNGSSNLTTLTLSDSFDTSNVTYMNNMFYKCQNLHTIYVCNSFATTNTSNFGFSMFEDCPNLVGGNGTTYNSSHVDATYARIDGENGQPGYFTAKP